METEIRDTAIMCPDHGIHLVHIPKPIADDIVVCPRCGMGGTYKYVVEEGGNLVRAYVPLYQVEELLRQCGYPRE